MTTVRSILAVARAVAWRGLHNAFTNPALLLPSLLFPLFFFVAFAGGLSRIATVPGFDYPEGYTAFQYVFVLTQASAFGGVFTGFSVARDFEVGFSRRLLLAAPRREGIVLGYAITAMVRAIVTITFITVVALAVGMRIGGDALDLAGLYTLALLINLSTTLFAVGVAMRLRTMQAGPLMQIPIFILLFLAPVYVPLDLLAGWVAAVAKYNPATLFLETGRELLAGQPATVAAAFGAVLAIVALLVLWAWRGLRRAEAAG
jgi:ABC-2 type transport system permease protein